MNINTTTRNPDSGDGHGTTPVSDPAPQRSTNIASEHLHLLTSILEKVDRRLTILEERLLSSDTQTNERAGFPQFRRLPAEIRLAIWELAIPRRLFTPWQDHRYDGSPHGVPRFCRSAEGLPPPSISRVCRESRSVARKRGKMFLLYQDRGMRQRFSYWTWFDGAHDVVQLREHSIPKPFGFEDGLKELLRHAESILVQACFVQRSWVDWLFKSEMRSALRTINIQRTAPETAHRLRWHPEAIVKLMGSESFFMLDLEDPGEVHRVLEVLECNTSRQCWNFQFWHHCWVTMMAKGGDNDITTAQNTFRDCWLSREYTDEESNEHSSDAESNGYPPDEESNEHPFDESSDTSLTELQRGLEGMPEIRLVYTFEKDNGTDVSPREKEIPFHPRYEFDR